VALILINFFNIGYGGIMKLKPEILSHPNIPLPLHGLSPRVINGDLWWNRIRKEVYERYDFHCIACGVEKYKAEIHHWLEAHEFYEVDYINGTMKCKSIEPLCHYCHNFIHSGRLEAVLGKEKSINEVKLILEHGFKILSENHLKCFWGTLEFAAKVSCMGFGIVNTFGVVANPKPIELPWEKWRLIWNGKAYYSKFKNEAELEAHYKSLEKEPIMDRPVSTVRAVNVALKAQSLPTEDQKSRPVLIIGKSGAGKTRSLINLNPLNTFLVNVMGKDLPFKGWRQKYNATNMLISTSYPEIENKMDVIKKRKELKYIVIDDFQYLMADEFMRRGLEKGYDKFTELGMHAYNLIKKASAMGNGRIVFFLAHSDTNDAGEEKVKTIGKMLDEKICVEGMFTIVLNCARVKDQFGFMTKNNGKNTTKSPEGMFNADFIPNDLSIVAKAISDYEVS
jgi:hypothetical protein